MRYKIKTNKKREDKLCRDTNRDKTDTNKIVIINLTVFERSLKLIQNSAIITTKSELRNSFYS